MWLRKTPAVAFAARATLLAFLSRDSNAFVIGRLNSCMFYFSLMLVASKTDRRRENTKRHQFSSK